MPVTDTPAIDTTNLTKMFATQRGIVNVNLTVNRGEIFGFLGPNGAGKSTTLRTLMGFMRPTSGSARILDMDAHAQTVEVHRRVGNLPTEFSLEDRMTGLAMLTLFAQLRGIDGALDYARELAGRLDADLDRPMRRLSRGNKQKIGLIQALFHKPEVIILDEPTGGLDPLVQDVFLSIMRESRDRGQTVLFSSHVLAEVERVADRVGIIRDGELVAVEDPEALAGRSWRIMRIQFDGRPDSAVLNDLQAVDGVEQLEVMNDSVSFVVRWNMDTVLRMLTRHPILQLDSERPSLEEIFLTYYGQGTHQ